MRRYFDGENAIVELKNALTDLKKEDKKPFYITIAVLCIVALGLGALIYFIIKNKCAEEEYDDCDWDDYDDDECGCGCGCDDDEEDEDEDEDSTEEE